MAVAIVPARSCPSTHRSPDLAPAHGTAHRPSDRPVYGTASLLAVGQRTVHQCVCSSCVVHSPPSFRIS